MPAMRFVRTCPWALLAGLALAQTSQPQYSTSSSCSLPTASASLPAPSVAPGYDVRLVATGLYNPRGIVFDAAGNLLVIEQTSGLVAIRLDDAGGACVAESSRHTVLNDTSLNHGIALSRDGFTLYVSSPENVTSYAYNPSNATVSGPASLLVANMTTSDHTTRTLLLSSFANDTLLISRGSTANIDIQASNISSGHSQIKAFNISAQNTHSVQNFNLNGTRLGWGLRNDVGMAEHPMSGGLYSVENSADEIRRETVDVHINNPAEELNYMGTLVNNTSPNQGGNFGYPECFTAWGVADLPDNSNLQVGEQFALQQNATANDTYCRDSVFGPRLAFQAHMAPLDIKFNANGSEAWIAFHGSWDRSPPAGYKVGVVQFGTDGQPLEPTNSTTALVDIVSNPDITQCPMNCFRPVGLTWDSQGRLWFSSDATGELYVLTSAQRANGSITNPTPSVTVPNNVGTATPTQSTGAAALPTRMTEVGMAGLVGFVAYALAI